MIGYSVGYRQIGNAYMPLYMYDIAAATLGNVKQGFVQYDKAFRAYSGMGYFGNTNGSLAGATGTIQAIVSSTNASPIVLTVASTANFALNDAVIVGGHLVNTGANNTPGQPTWIVSVIAPTTLTLLGSVGVGVGGATGTVYKTTGTNRPVCIPGRASKPGVRTTLGQTNGT